MKHSYLFWWLCARRVDFLYWLECCDTKLYQWFDARGWEDWYDRLPDLGVYGRRKRAEHQCIQWTGKNIYGTPMEAQNVVE